MPRPKAPQIRQRTFPQLVGVRWEVDLGIVEGKRVRRVFKTRGEAEIWLAEQKALLKGHGESAVAISEADRVRFAAARDQLAMVNASIEDAVRFFLQHHRPLKADLGLGRLLDLAADDKRLNGARERYVSQFLCSCRSFLRGKEDRGASTVTKDEVRRWVLGNGWKPKTQRVYLGDLRTLFAWAVENDYLATNPIAGDAGFIKLAEMEDGEITAFDPETCARLLWWLLFGRYERWDAAQRVMVEADYRELLGFAALTMFAGVRPVEVERIQLGQLDLRGRTVIVRGRDAKTRQRRVVELDGVCVAWLRLWQRLCPGCPFRPRNFTRRWKALRKAAGLKEWPHDVLRHTAATYDYALHGDTARLQSRLGHSEDEDTLFRHYRAVVTLEGRAVSRRLAEEFYSLTPRRVRLLGIERKWGFPG